MVLSHFVMQVSRQNGMQRVESLQVGFTGAHVPFGITGENRRALTCGLASGRIDMDHGGCNS